MNTHKKSQIFFYKSKEYDFLSNFYSCDIFIDGRKYRSAEHLYQSSKSTNEEVKDWIISAPTAFYAMIAGRNVKLKDLKQNWSKIKIGIMRDAQLAKFRQNPDLKEKLLATGNAELHENNPRELFWGSFGEDVFGKILVEVRTILQKEQLKENVRE